MSVEHILARCGPRRLLALDGGGIRGVISIEILKKIESLLREQTGNPTLVLADYFDYIAGTSIGAVIAAGLALGKSVDELRSVYREGGREMFTSAGIAARWRHKFTAEKLTERIKLEVGPQTTLGDARLKTLLMFVLRNATTDSPWLISNNPRAMFNDQTLPGCNLDYPLWKLVRASTAAPSFFPPEVIEVEGRQMVFVDGAITAYNNPAFLLFLMATATPYRLCWPVGEDEMLLVSIGTGTAAAENSRLRPEQMNLLYHATTVPAALLAASLHQQDILCRLFGRCLSGAPIDMEIGDLLDGLTCDGKAAPRAPTFRTVQGTVARLFTYVRYNADLSREGLDRLGLTTIDPQCIWRIDCPENIPALETIGRRVAERDVRADLLAKFAVPDVARRA